MQIIGKVIGRNYGDREADISIYLQGKDEKKAINFAFRKPEICDYDKVLFGLEDNRLYILCGDNNPNALTMSRKSDRCYVRSKHPDIVNLLQNKTGDYSVKRDKVKREFYIEVERSE